MSISAADPFRPGDGGARPPVHLHIGLPRTGLSAAQVMLDERRDAVHAAGLLYARTGVTAHHHFDVAQAFLAARPVPVAQRERTLADLRAELAAADRPVLLSSEHFSDASEDDIRAMAGFFGKGTRIVVTLREPVAWTSVMFAEAIRWGHRLSFEQFLDGFRLSLDYEPLLRRWEAGFGRSALRIIPVDREPGALPATFLGGLLPPGLIDWPGGADETALPAPLVHLQGLMSEGEPNGVGVEPGLRRIVEACTREGVPIPRDWRIPDTYTRDFLALDRANDRISRDFGLPFPLFGRTVTALLEENRRTAYGATSVARWMPALRDAR